MTLFQNRTNCSSKISLLWTVGKIGGLRSQKCLSCVKHTVCNLCHQGVLNQNKIKDAGSMGWWELLSSLLNDDHCQPNSIWCGSVKNDGEENLEKCIYAHFLPRTQPVSKAARLLMQQQRGNFSAKGREVATRSISSAMEKCFRVSKIDGGIFPLSSLIS